MLGFVRSTQEVGVGGVGLFSRHTIVKTFGLQERAHFSAAAQFINKVTVKPGLIDLQIRIGQQTITIETFDVIALVGRTVAPDVYAIFARGVNQHRARHSAAQRRRVEIRLTGSRNVEST